MSLFYLVKFDSLGLDSFAISRLHIRSSLFFQKIVSGNL